MIHTKWVNFTITNLTNEIETNYTQEEFEKLTDDKFVAVETNEEGKPVYIWMERCVYTIKTFEKLAFGSPAIIGAPRNPDWKVTK